MAPESLKTATVVKTLLIVVFLEAIAWAAAGIRALPPLAILGAVRLAQIGGILLLLKYYEKGPASIAWSPGTWKTGAVKGAVWSLAFGITAFAGMAILHLAGRDPIAMLHFPLPLNGTDLLLFLLVGGLIGPLAEEICFRGILYTYFRRWGIVFALFASTTIFVCLHAVHGLPLTQIVGGLVFAIAYETTRNLMTPIVIHVTGNLALFALSMAGTWLR